MFRIEVCIRYHCLFNVICIILNVFLLFTDAHLISQKRVTGVHADIGRGIESSFDWNMANMLSSFVRQVHDSDAFQRAIQLYNKMPIRRISHNFQPNDP